MNIEKKINSQDILNAIDLNKINFTDKKKRGRPKKSQQLINPTISKINFQTFFLILYSIIIKMIGGTKKSNQIYL